jgi:predicted DsbA family dithiol-disulfide isomerase
VMGGLAREFHDPPATVREILEAAAASQMPVDPRMWLDRPPSGSYPACQAVKAAAEQRLDGPYLRALREGMMARGRALDTASTLLEEARAVPGLDVARFEIDLRSHAIVESFGADLDRTRAAAPEGQDRAALPTFEVDGAWLRGEHRLEPLRDAVMAAGATPGALPSVEQALGRFGSMATAEVAAVCDLPGPPAAAELWRLAAGWRARPERVLGGELWSLA